MFPSPTRFEGKKVLVVGFGNTACEVSLNLLGHAAKIYQSYGRGRLLLSRYDDDGVPMDLNFTWPDLRLKYLLDYVAPWLMKPLTDKFLINAMIRAAARSEPVEAGVSYSQRLKRTEKRMREDWHMLPCTSMAHIHPVVQEDYIPAVRRGDILPVKAFQDFSGEKEVLLTDGTVIEVDAVVFCTGYKLDLSIMPELEMDGACGVPLQTAEQIAQAQTTGQNGAGSKSSNSSKQEPHLPRLYQMMFPPRWASSVAILSWMSAQESRWAILELASMALSQVWAAETAKTSGSQMPQGKYRKPALLPSETEMNAEVDRYHAWWRKEWNADRSILQGFVRGHSFYRFLHDAAGTGMYEHIDHILGGRGWRLRSQDRELWTWLAKGPLNSYSWRLFETNPQGIPGCGRKAWPEARKAVQEAVSTTHSAR